MVLHIELIPQTVARITAFTCDRCSKYIPDNDCYEFQEAHHISFVGGYGSVFGDGVKVECDLCQKCMKELIGGISRIASTEN